MWYLTLKYGLSGLLTECPSYPPNVSVLPGPVSRIVCSVQFLFSSPAFRRVFSARNPGLVERRGGGCFPDLGLSLCAFPLTGSGSSTGPEGLALPDFSILFLLPCKTSMWCLGRISLRCGAKHTPGEGVKADVERRACVSSPPQDCRPAGCSPGSPDSCFMYLSTSTVAFAGYGV